MAKQDNTLLILVGAAVVAGIYFISNKQKPAPQLAPVIPMNPQPKSLDYLKPVEDTSVSDIMSTLSSSGVSTSAPPLQFTPPDAETLNPLNLDLMVQPPTSNETSIVSEENQEDV